MDERMERTLNALRKNNMDAYYAETADEAREKAISLIEDGATVAVGGSVTLTALGLIDVFRSGNYRFLDRYRAENADETRKIFIDSFSADVYVCSSNAITENGELFNVDGTGNRVAAILFGPKRVVIIAGANKIVKDLDEAQLRVKQTAAPLNVQRLHKNTYCAHNGRCAAPDGCGNRITDGCRAADRICCDYVVCGPQAVKGRITVILCGENLGY